MPTRIRIDARVRVNREDLTDEDVEELQKLFTYKNPEHATKLALKLSTWGTPPKITTWREEWDDATESADLTFPRGGYRRVRDLLEARGHKVVAKDRRHEGAPCPRFPRYRGPALRYYQEAGIEAAVARQTGIVRAPTGSGKSLMAIAYAAKLGLNTLVILPTVALFKQWCKDALKALDVRERDLGVVHGKKRKLRPLTVAVQGTLAAHGVDEELRDFFGVVIVDECQKCAARTYIEAVDPFPAKYRLGVSADERRKDRKEFLTHDLFSDVAYEVKRDELEKSGHVLDVEIRVVPTDFEAPWFGIVDEDDAGSEKEGVNFGRLLDEMTSDEKRNAIVERLVVEEVERGEQLLVLTHRREHCQSIVRALVAHGVRSGFFIGGADYAREFDQTRAGIEGGSVRAGVGTYGALGFGINLPSVGAGVAATPIAGNKQNFNQVRGRFCRTAAGKTSARLYYLWDKRVYPGHLRNLLAWNGRVTILERGRWVDARKRSRQR